MKKRYNILFVSHENTVNGSSVSLLSLIIGLKEIYGNKIKITVLIPTKLGKYNQAEEFFKENGIQCKKILYRNNYKNIEAKTSTLKHIHDFWNFMAVRVLFHYIKKSKFDFVCSNSSAVDVGARAALLLKKPHIYYIREFMEEDHGLEYRNKVRMKQLLENSSYIIFISKAIQKKYESIYCLRNTSQFYNGFIIKDYYVENHSILNTEKVYLIQVGCLSDGKGALNSIELMNTLKIEKVENFHLEFVGDGSNEYKMQMEKLIKKYELQNFITISAYSNKIKEKLATKDILLMNSRSEGFGRVTIEAMLAGCLVLGRSNAGTTEIIKNEKNGILFNNNDEFILKFKNVINNRDHYKRMAKCGQKWSMQEFDYSKTAKKFNQFINQKEFSYYAAR